MTNEEAIKTLEANYPDACFEQLREAVDAAIEALKAQEVSNNSSELDNNIGDLIRRSATIDAVCKAGCGSGYCGISCDDVKAIEQLPSAQAERTCVNCGRTANNGGWYADGGTRCPIEEHYALPKDGFCHLWEKRNVTDDDYPERREE